MQTNLETKIPSFLLFKNVVLCFCIIEIFTFPFKYAKTHPVMKLLCEYQLGLKVIFLSWNSFKTLYITAKSYDFLIKTKERNPNQKEWSLGDTRDPGSVLTGCQLGKLLISKKQGLIISQRDHLLALLAMVGRVQG